MDNDNGNDNGRTTATSISRMHTSTSTITKSIEKKRSAASDSDESENENQLKKTKKQTFWLYISSEECNIAVYVLKQPKSFEQEVSKFAQEAVDFTSIKLYTAKKIVRLNCNSENQQKYLALIKTIGNFKVTASLPWATTNNQVFRETKQAKTFKYVISGVSHEYNETEIEHATGCKEAIRISKKQENELVTTETCILIYENAVQLPFTVSIGFIKYRLRAYEPAPMRCKNCLAFGHTSKHCSHDSRCMHCGKSGHLYEACSNKTKETIRCANCGGQHSAMDKNCPKFTQARDAIRKTVANRGLTYGQALVGNTNTAAVEGATVDTSAKLNLPAVVIQHMEKIKNEMSANLEKFSNQLSKDIQHVLAEYGSEIHKLKTVVSDNISKLESRCTILTQEIKTAENKFAFAISNAEKLFEQKIADSSNSIDAKIKSLIAEQDIKNDAIIAKIASINTKANKNRNEIKETDKLHDSLAEVTGILLGAVQLHYSQIKTNIVPRSSLDDIKKALIATKSHNSDLETVIKEHYWEEIANASLLLT